MSFEKPHLVSYFKKNISSRPIPTSWNLQMKLETASKHIVFAADSNLYESRWISHGVDRVV